MAGFGLGLSVIWIPSIKSEVRQLYEDAPKAEHPVIEILQRFNPSKVIKQNLRPQVLLSNITCGFLGVTQYGVLTSIRHIINPRFHLTTPLVSGLFYLAPGLGFIMGAILGGRLSDYTVKRYIRKRDGVRLPKDRLNSSLVYILGVLPVSMLLYGWALEKKLGGLALPIVMAFWIGTGLMGAWNALNTYSAGEYTHFTYRPVLIP